MPIEIDLPEDILLKIKTDREIEKDISEDIKEDIFLSMLFDKALEHSELTQKDIDETDRKIKRDIRGARVEVVVDTNVIISALLKDGSAGKLLLLAPFRFYTVPYARREIEKHRSGLVKRAGIDDETFQYLMDKIFERIEVISPRPINHEIPFPGYRCL